MAPQSAKASSMSVQWKFLTSFLGVLRMSQITLGTVVWMIITISRYEGALHYVVFVAVFFWLTTLALFFLTLLSKSDLVPLLGGERWTLSNALHDWLAAILYLVADCLISKKTQDKKFCDLPTYTLPCSYKSYLSATIFACLCTLLYIISAIYCTYKKCRGDQPVI
ncbi:MARVEL domain-containing protein 1 [Hemiscyllium ocellatum]|uniref:MARVEL domain-containing protein 1 n=1 Tax=Hemiscyllium ocellatum TaxID=170820 RepID=UPI002966229E|nr:MARVEL domain-containing protein 1 [Hemiscyllium ocellatum]